MKKWISLLTAVLLLALCACGADPNTTAAPQTTSTAPTTQVAVPTTVAPTTRPTAPTTAPDPMRADNDEFWGMYSGKVFVYSANEGDKNQAPTVHRLHLYTDGSYDNQHFFMNAGWRSTDKGNWVFEDGILTLYDSVYLQEFDAWHTYVTQLRYENGVLIFIKGNNDVASFSAEKDGVEYKYDSILE